MAPPPEEHWSAHINVTRGGFRGSRLVTEFPGSHFLFEGRHFAWRPDRGAIVYVQEPDTHDENCPSQSELRIVAVDVTSRRTELVATVRGNEGIFLNDAALAVSPDGDEYAVIISTLNAEGWRMNVGIVDGIGGYVRVITNYHAPEVGEVAGMHGLAWRRDRIYYVRENRARLGYTETAEGHGLREIWSVDADGCDARQETHGPDDGMPAPHPSDDVVAFVRGDGSLCLRDANGQVRTLIEGGGRGGRGYCMGPLDWSPDGRKLAFTWVGTRHGVPTIWVGEVVRE